MDRSKPGTRTAPATVVSMPDSQGGTEPRSQAANGRTAPPPWRQWFDRWDAGATAALEQLLRTQPLLELGGSALTASMKLWSMGQRTRDAWWSAWGLPTQREQQRLLHELHRLQSRLLDLTEQLQARDAEDDHGR